MCNDSLHDDNCRIDYHSEVDGSQAHQISVNAKSTHHTKGEEHTERYDASYDKTCPPISEEDDEHEDDNQTALDEVVCNGAFYSIYKFI